MDTEKTISQLLVFAALTPNLNSLIHALVLHLAYEIGLPHLAYAAIKTYFCHTHDEKERDKLLIPLIETMLGLASSDKYTQASRVEPIVQIIESEIRTNVGQNDPCRAGLVMTQLWMQVKDRSCLSQPTGDQ